MKKVLSAWKLLAFYHKNSPRSHLTETLTEALSLLGCMTICFRDKSFDYYVEKYNPKKHDRFIIYTKDLAQDNDIIFIPIYMTMCL